MDQNNQQPEPKKKNNPIINKVIIIALIIGLASILTACAKQTTVTQQNTNQTDTTMSAEDQIKEVLKNYYTLNGQRKFGDAYQYVTNASNVSQKDYVDYQSERGPFITGFKDISYNYIEVEGYTADVSVTIVWNQMANPLVNGDTYNQDSEIQLVKEESNWKILWKTIDDSNENVTSTNINQ